MDVRVWLKGQGLEEHADAFDENGIDADLLADLTNDDLKELGIIRLGDRKRLLKTIALLSEHESEAGEDIKPRKRPQAPLASLAPSEGDRRQVTIFFADLSGYTELSDELDAEDLHHLVGLVFDDIDRIIKNYGGTVHRHIGDEVMALFGTPIAHSDDPFRAVSAAFDTHKAMEALSAQQGREIDVHVGIASGSVVIAGQGTENSEDVPEYAVTGVAANLAARLNSMAESGDTIISDAVYKTVSGQVECDTLGEVKVKGLSKSVLTWRAKALRSQGLKHSRGDFIGRRAEANQFNGALEACRDTGNGQAILLRGEAGMGKSRLVEEFESNADNLGFVCHKGLNFDFGVGEGHDAIRTLVYSMLDVPPSSDVPARVVAAGNAIAKGLYSLEQQMFLNDLLNLPLADELQGLYDALGIAERTEGKHKLLAQLVQGVSETYPRLFVVEDVHWADAETLDDLAQISAAVQDCTSILVMTSRIEGDPLDQTWRNTSGGNSLLTLDIGPLRQAEAAELAGKFSHAIDDYTKNCIERAGGNPLFLEQLLRSTEESRDDEVPPTIQSLIMARIDRLDAQDKRALQAASAIGQQFSLDMLRALLSDPNYTCAKLIGHQLVRPQGEGFLFSHALIQEGVYASLLKDKRGRLHREAAKWFAGHDPVLRAQHLDRAEDNEASPAYLEAANGQATLYRYEQAMRLIERGLELAKITPDIFSLSCEKGKLQHDMGLIDSSIQTYKGVLDIASNEQEKCDALLGLAAGLRISDKHVEALEIIDRAEAAIIGLGMESTRAKIHHLRGNLYFPMGRIEECAAEHEKSLEYARVAGSPEAEASALSGVADASYVAGHMETSFTYFSRCVAVAKMNGFGRIEAVNSTMVGFTRQYLNEFSEAARNGLDAIKASSKIGHKRAEMMAETLMSNALYETEEYSDAIGHNARALEFSRQLGAPRFEAQALLYQGKLENALGQKELSVQLLKKAIKVSAKAGHSFAGPRIMSATALALSDPKAKLKALDDGLKMLEAGSVSHNYLHFYPDAIEVSLELKDWAKVELYATSLESYTKDEPLPWSIFFIDRGRALSRWRQGQRDPELKAEIERLCDVAQRGKLIRAMRALEKAREEARG